ncbi:MAG TPA: hypothetical protein PKY82_35485 [Pyrinomonadaceae bacterium]|nr:hypothetical protein [Pyrinomonadaceae bacterium]
MNKKILISFAICLSILSFTNLSFAQTIKRTTYKNDTIELGAGGTLTIIGAPNGSITIEGWNKNEVEISAEIEMQGANEADLAEIAKVSGFAIDQQFGHVTIMSVGTHDKEYLKKVTKNFPKKLLNSPLKIDYKIKVPNYCDLDINSGTGDLTLSKVEGAIQIKAYEGNASLNLTGGMVNATFGKGNVDVKIGNRSWRGRESSVQLANGTLNVQFPNNMNAEIDASVLRNGKIENSLTTLKPRNQTKFSETSMLAKSGNGGALLSFTIGDGTLKMSNW